MTPEDRASDDTSHAHGIDAAAVERWREISELWHEIYDLDDAARQARLDEPSLNARLRDEVRSLLAAESVVTDRFDAPPHLTLPDGVNSAASRDDDTAAASLVGRRLGPFRVLRRVGQGGMGAVYEAAREDAAYEQRVALKSLWRGTDSAVLLQRFRTERQILAGLGHPNIAQLLDGGSTPEGTPWLALEFVDGVPIDEYCDGAALGLAARLDLFRQVCAAVHFAHRQLVVHRDIKPSNVFVDRGGTVKLLDFGVAKLLDPERGAGTLTEAGLAPFTAAWAAPEQLSGDPITVATDVYSLGVLLVHLLAGAAPIDLQGVSSGAALDRIRHVAPKPPSVIVRSLAEDVAARTARCRGFASAERLARALAGELDAIALMALRKEPERRYSSVEALSHDVHRHLRRDRVHARPDSLRYRVTAQARRRPALMTGALVALLGAGVAGALWWQQAAVQRREAQRTERVANFMARLVAGPDVSNGDPLVHIGPRGTIAELLDGAIARVPAEFPDDPRSRARLYTAIGSNLMAQERVVEAEAALDSAVQLARVTYGVASEPFAIAALALARVRFTRGGPAAARSVLAEAESSIAAQRRAGVGGELLRTPRVQATSFEPLAASAQLLRGRVQRAEGEVRVADSLARLVLARPPSARPFARMTTVRALLLVAITEAWLVRDPRAYVRRCRHAVALSDSIGRRLSTERLEGVLCQADGLLTLGRVADADSLLRDARRSYEAAYGDATSAMASLLAQSANIAAAQGHMAEQRALVTRAQQLLERGEGAAAETIVSIASTLVDLRRSEGELGEALRLARWARDRVTPQQVAVATVVAEFTLARAELARGNHAGAEAALRRALATLPASGDLDSLRPQLLRVLLTSATQRGDGILADSVRALLPPPRPPAPDCTPGGRWIGCPLG